MKLPSQRINETKFKSSIIFDLNDEKRIAPNILNSYMKFKKFAYSTNFKTDIKHLINPFLILRKNSISLLSMSKAKSEKISQKFKHINNKPKIIKKRKEKSAIINSKRKKKEKEKENMFKPKYKILMENLSFNGNSKVYFRNLSNSKLDEIFQNKLFNPFIIPNSRQNSNSQILFKESKYEKIHNKIKKDNSCIILGKNNNNNYSKIINSNDIDFEKKTKIVRNNNKDIHNESIKNNIKYKGFGRESKDIFYDTKQNTPLSSNREENKKTNTIINSLIGEKEENLKAKKIIQVTYLNKFNSFKIKLRKQNDVNSNLINNIKKEEALSKYRLQVGIVKLNAYKTKNRIFKNYKF